MADVSEEFNPTGYSKKGCPDCYGHFISGRKCDCMFMESCREYTFSNKAERKRNIHYRDFEWVPFDDARDIIDIDEISDSSSYDYYDDSIWDNNISNELDEEDSFVLPNGINISTESININIIKIIVWLTIENPVAMKSLMLKMDPKVKCLQDIADVFGLSKQAIQKRIAGELGVGKTHFKASNLVSLTQNEMDVYRLVFVENMSIGKAASTIGISKTMATTIVNKIKKMGFIRK